MDGAKIRISEQITKYYLSFFQARVPKTKSGLDISNETTKYFGINIHSHKNILKRLDYFFVFPNPIGSTLLLPIEQ